MIQSGGFCRENFICAGKNHVYFICAGKNHVSREIFFYMKNRLTEELEGYFLAPLNLNIFFRVIWVSVHGIFAWDGGLVHKEQ